MKFKYLDEYIVSFFGYYSNKILSVYLFFKINFKLRFYNQHILTHFVS